VLRHLLAKKETANNTAGEGYAAIPINAIKIRRLNWDFIRCSGTF
jgi:hypothetical protein